MTISKLLVELENTHGDASLVSRSSSGLLNRVERLSASFLIKAFLKAFADEIEVVRLQPTRWRLITAMS